MSGWFDENSFSIICKKYSNILIKSLKILCFWSQFIAISPQCGDHKDFSLNPIGIWSFQFQLLQAKYSKTLIHKMTECENMLQLFNLISPR